MHRSLTVAPVCLFAPLTMAVPPLVIDDFVDPQVSELITTELVVIQEPSSGVGGFTAGTFESPLDREATLSINQAPSTLRVTTLGQANLYLGYGFRIVPGGATPTTNSVFSIEQDFSEYEILRINFTEYTNADVDIVTDVQMLTFRESGGFGIVSGRYMPPRGVAAPFDVVIADIPEATTGFEIGSVGAVSFRFFTFPFTSEGLAFSIESIELIDLDDVAVCAGDCDDSGTVNFADLVAMLFQFGNDTGDGCDADASGVVNFADLVSALFAFGPCPE